MGKFRIAPQRRQRALAFPEVRRFSPEVLRQRPYRSGVSRALAASLSTLCAGSAAAQGLWGTASSPNSQPMLMGVVAPNPQPMIADLIEPSAARDLIARLFTEAGLTLSFEGHCFGKITDSIEGWDADHRVGVAMIDAHDFTNERIYANFLERTLGPQIHLADDPRDRLTDWEAGLDLKEQAELDRGVNAFGRWPRPRASSPVHGATADGSQILWFDAQELMATAVSANQPADPAELVQARAEALQHLESQVRGFLEYLQSQGM